MNLPYALLAFQGSERALAHRRHHGLPALHRLPEDAGRAGGRHHTQVRHMVQWCPVFASLVEFSRNFDWKSNSNQLGIADMSQIIYKRSDKTTSNRATGGNWISLNLVYGQHMSWNFRSCYFRVYEWVANTIDWEIDGLAKGILLSPLLFMNLSLWYVYMSFRVVVLQNW